MQLREFSRAATSGADDNHVILLVGRPSQEEARAFWYAERIRTEDFHAVHFAEKGDPKGLEATVGAADRDTADVPFARDSPERRGPGISVRSYITRMRERVPTEDFITVIVSERVEPGLVRLGSRTALLLKLSLLFTPDVVVTNVPFIEGTEHAGVSRHGPGHSVTS